MRVLTATLLLALIASSTLAVSTSMAQDSAEKPAYFMQMSEDWLLDGDLPQNVLIISLQGLANREAPNFYLVYGPTWPWTITGPIKEFYEEKHNFNFQELKTADEALTALSNHAKGYVVWDKEVRTSLLVSMTVAGLEDLVIVNEDLIPLVEKHGLEMKVDLRGQFTGMPDHEIYQIAFDRYWEDSSRDVVVWMGGYHHPKIEPGMLDWAIYRRAFVSDLSNSPKHPEELALAKRIYAEQNPQSFVMGWHSYAKDTEGQMTSLVSQNGLRMEGLNSLPNLSFSTQVPFSEGFTFENNHSVEPDEVLVPEDKVYITLSQTDGMGIGAWTLPGRGKLPYAWAVPLSWADLAPGALEYFYQSKTPNDYLIGYAFPSYMYPKPVPLSAYPDLQRETRRLMEKLDLRVMDIMDYSEGNRHVGNTDLPEDLVDRLFDGYPDVIGFTNGYGSARTFYSRDGRALVSYDYYLGSNRSKEEAIADIEELIALNKKRPYFMLIHVRQSSSLEKVADILDGVSEPFELVPLDVFLKLAGSEPTFETRFLQEGDPVYVGG